MSPRALKLAPAIQSYARGNLSYLNTGLKRHFRRVFQVL